MGCKTYIVVTPFFPSPESWRGAYCYDFVVALKKALPREWRVEVFLPGNGPDYKIGGIVVHRFTTWHLPSNILPFLFRKRNERSFIKAIERSDVKAVDVAVCHGHTANFAIYPLALKRENQACLTLLHHHDLMSFGLNNGRLRHWGLYNRFIAKQLKRFHETIDCHVFISRLCEKSFRSFPDIDWLGDGDYSAQVKGVKGMGPVRVKRSIILHNGVDVNVFRPRNMPNTRKDSAFVIGCVGNISREKGQYDLLCATCIVKEALPDCQIKVKFVGSGDDLPRCRIYAAQHGIDAEFLPERRHEELAAFYRGLDLFVLPTWLDGFGCVYTEAYACGVPFIASTTAGVEELIRDDERDLWLVEPRYPQRLAEKIMYFIEHRAEQKLAYDIDIKTIVCKFCERVVRN